ncbi:hypothetical protein [Streptomyces sp. NPDC018038]
MLELRLPLVAGAVLERDRELFDRVGHVQDPGGGWSGWGRGGC